jgi:hypothetical protein
MINQYNNKLIDLLIYSVQSLIIYKGKAIPVTGRGGPKGCETSRLPHFPDNRLIDGGEVVSLTGRPPFTPRKIPGTHLLETESNPRPPACSIVPQPTMEVQVHAFLSSTVDRGKWPASRPDCFSRGTQWIGGWMGPARTSVTAHISMSDTKGPLPYMMDGSAQRMGEGHIQI